ncbi:B3 DNA binding domain-containing protein [Artemisia annua]|uniref:B3 DNA binding domain-containing protein n=1 Tax=Artemisia annua TaxID=35608 RepID=A0A2U1Q6U8_ARTAN|nr:B3 DNA binding domain-containing protein [Artemisia annua]
MEHFLQSIPISYQKYLVSLRKNETAILKRGCRKWHVKIDKDWVFGEGWETFVRENGVQEFDFVVFKHEGNMVFDIMVFDTSSCEREYPIHKDMTMKTKKAWLEEKSFGKCKTDIDVLKKTPKVKDTYINKSTKSLKSEKTMTPDHSNYPFFIGTLKAPANKLFLPVSFTKSNGLRTGEMILRNGQTELSWIVDLKIYQGNYYFIGRGWPAFYIENGLKQGDSFKLEFVQTEIDSMAIFYRLSEENRCFKSIATASCINNSYVHVPLGFARSNGFFNMNNSEMVVMDEKQRLWQTKVCPARDRVRIRGFKDIFAANELKAGDEFLLELVDNGKKPLMNVKCNLFLPICLSICCLKHTTVIQIFISHISIIMPCHQHEKGSIGVRANWISKSQDSTLTFWHKSIPISYQKYLVSRRKNETAILKRGCRKWHVKIDKDWVFGEGWETFVRENGVQEFDFVVFKHEGNMVFDIMVFDTSSCEREYPIHKDMTMKTKKAWLEEKSFGKCKTDIDVLKKTPKVKDTYINKSTKSLKSEKTMTPDHSNYPFFIGTLKAPANNLFLPVSFTKSNGLRTGEMILRNGQTELSWIVDLKIYQGNYYFIGRGWPAFYIENGLKQGDSFKLEFVQTEIDSMAIFYRLSEENRCFKSIATASCINNSYVHVPLGFARSNGFFNMNNSEMVVMDEKQRLWQTKVCPARDRVRIRGFKDIFAANELKAGDEFLLELVDNGKKPLMNVKCNLFLPICLSICCLKHTTVIQIFISHISIIMPCHQHEKGSIGVRANWISKSQDSTLTFWHKVFKKHRLLILLDPLMSSTLLLSALLLSAEYP